MPSRKEHEFGVPIPGEILPPEKWAKTALKRLPADHRLHLAVRQFLKIVRIVPWDSEAADWYAEIRHQLVSSGQPIGELDMMIAAHALSAGAVLVTNNSRHYERIEAPLILENWAS